MLSLHYWEGREPERHHRAAVARSLTKLDRVGLVNRPVPRVNKTEEQDAGQASRSFLLGGCKRAAVVSIVGLTSGASPGTVRVPFLTLKGAIMSRHSRQEIQMTNRSAHPDHEIIEALAYQLWLDRGSPAGSPEIDWRRAEEELRNSAQSARQAA